MKATTNVTSKKLLQGELGDKQESFFKRVEKVLGVRGMNWKQLAESLGTSKQTVNCYKNMSTPVSLVVSFAIAETLKVPIAALLDDEELSKIL